MKHRMTVMQSRCHNGQFCRAPSKSVYINRHPQSDPNRRRHGAHQRIVRVITRLRNQHDWRRPSGIVFQIRIKRLAAAVCLSAMSGQAIGRRPLGLGHHERRACYILSQSVSQSVRHGIEDFAKRAYLGHASRRWARGSRVP